MPIRLKDGQHDKDASKFAQQHVIIENICGQNLPRHMTWLCGTRLVAEYLHPFVSLRRLAEAA